MANQQLANELMTTFMGIKNQHFHNIIKADGHTHNEKLVLFLLHELSKPEDGHKVLLSKLRDRIQLAPSTVTPIIASLEAEELIERVIDKIDRRNIYLMLSQKGITYTSEAHDKLMNKLDTYIQYMGEDDTKEFIRLLRKTNIFLKERKEE